MSMGGTGVWNMILSYPYYFAAAIPMCGMVPAQWYTCLLYTSRCV